MHKINCFRFSSIKFSFTFSMNFIQLWPIFSDPHYSFLKIHRGGPDSQTRHLNNVLGLELVVICLDIEEFTSDFFGCAISCLNYYFYLICLPTIPTLESSLCWLILLLWFPLWLSHRFLGKLRVPLADCGCTINYWLIS